METGVQDGIRSALVEAIAAQTKFTATSLAKELGRDGTYLRDFLKGKKRTIGAAEISRLEAILGVPLVHKIKTPDSSREQSSVVADSTAPSFRSQGGRGRDVPELGIAVGGSEGDFLLNGDDAIGYVQRPPSLVGRDIFAVRVRNDSMEPRFEEGDLLYVERHREPRPGDYAVIELFSEEEQHAGPAFIKRLVSKNIATVVVRQFNPVKEITFQRDRVKALYRVLPHNELLGV